MKKDIKYGKLPRHLYNIYHFKFDKLLMYGHFENNKLICDKNATEKSFAKEDGIDKKGECQLFNQTIKGLKGIKDYKDNDESFFEEIFVNIDFSDFISSQRSSFISLLLKIENGIELVINNKVITFVDFLKSNSMSKNCCMYFINKEYQNYIFDRVTLGFVKDNSKLKISKWYAYSGLSISDATILENIKLTKENIIVIPDSNYSTIIPSCITAISFRLLWEIADEIVGEIENDKYEDKELLIADLVNNSKELDLKDTLTKYQQEIQSYANSKDLYNIDVDNVEEEQIIKDFVLDLSSVFDKTIKEICSTLKELRTNPRYNDKHHYENTHNVELYWKKVRVNNYPTKINKFDGEGLITREFCQEIREELKKYSKEIDKKNHDEDEFGYSFQIRLPFIKGVVHSCDLKKFFKENNFTKLFGKTFDKRDERKEYDADKIKMILTESQFKAATFIGLIDKKDDESSIDAFMNKLEEYDYAFGISNLEPNHNDKVSLNYQFLSTIPYSKRDLDELIEENKEIFNESLSKEELTKAFDNFEDSLITLVENEEDIEDIEGNYLNNLSDTGKYKVLYDLNNEFYFSTKKFKNDRDSIEDSIRRDYFRMRIKCDGYRKLICSDLLELLYYSCNLEFSEEKMIPINSFYCPNITISSPNDKCIFLRNPHYSINEIGLLKKDKKNDERERYFSRLTGVVMINPLSFTADRMGGADYDGDTCIILTNKNRYSVVKTLESEEHPIVKIPSLGCNKVKYSYLEKVKCLYNTFSSRVGMMSFIALRDSFNIEDNHDDYYDKMSFYSIISGLEIDSAKQGIKPQMPKKVKNDLGSAFIQFKERLENGKDKITKKEYSEFANSFDNHNIYYVCQKINDFEKEKIVDSNYKLKINKENKRLLGKPEEYKDALISYYAYSLVMETLRKLKWIRNYEKKDINLEEVINNRLPNDIDKVEFIDKFMTNNPKETLKKYCESSDYYGYKYHYLYNYADKVDFIYNYLGIKNLDENDLDIITNFHKKGYYLLFLILCLNVQKANELDRNLEKIKYNNISFDILEENIKNDDLSEYISNNKDELNKAIIDLANDVLKKLSDMQNENTLSMKELEKEANSAFIGVTKNIDFNYFLAISNIFDDNIIYEVLFDKLIDYLRNGGLSK